MSEASHAVAVDHFASSKCASYFGVTVLPHVTIGYRNEVLVDCDGAIHLAQLRDYRETVPETTWSALMREAQLIRSRRLNIVYFNSTPQGGM